MQYIVLDMEWNQAWPGSYAARRPKPVDIHGEIIQIGAVRLTENQRVEDEFQILVRPKYFTKMHSKVASITGIRESMLRENGVLFPDAIARFRNWCGEDCVFLTWGFDDAGIMKENLALHGLDSSFCSRWYNAQMIFNAQTDGSSNQKSLGSALEIMGIEPSRPAHNALGDAYHTALICARLNLAKGIAEYGSSLKSHEDGFHGADIPGCRARNVLHGYATRLEVMEAVSVKENRCPSCGRRMTCGKWAHQPGGRFLTKASCPEHGDCFVRIRIVPEEDGTLRVNRLVYEPGDEMEQSYAALLEKAKKSHPHRRHRRGRPE